MDNSQLRNLLAPMTRGSQLTIPHVEYDLKIYFSRQGKFSLVAQSKEGNASGMSGGYASLSEFVDMAMYYFQPKPGHTYQHINSNIYKVLHIANEGSTRPEYPPSVVYQGSNGAVWVKPMDNFMRKMKRIK